MFTFSLTMVRHGETQYNKEKLLQGQGVDTPLSETGLQQCQALGQYLKDVPFTCVFVSNLQRAVQTAEIILKNNSQSRGVEMILEPLLRERGFGVAEGRPKEDLKNMANAAGKACRDYTPPGGETEEQVRLRFKQFLQVLFRHMLDKHTQAEAEASSPSLLAGGGGSALDGLQGASLHALVVSHGAYIRVAVRHLVEELDCSLSAAVKPALLFSPCPNTGVSRFTLTLTAAVPPPTLNAVCCVFANKKEHLEYLGEEQSPTDRRNNQTSDQSV